LLNKTGDLGLVQGAMRHARWAVIAVPLAALSGCVERQAIEDGVVVTFAWWVKAGVLVGCLVAALVGVRLPRTQLKWKVVSLALALLGGPLAVPALWLDSARISKEGLRIQSGL
jgi:hypothetical protein